MSDEGDKTSSGACFFSYLLSFGKYWCGVHRYYLQKWDEQKTVAALGAGAGNSQSSSKVEDIAHQSGMRDPKSPRCRSLSAALVFALEASEAEDAGAMDDVRSGQVYPWFILVQSAITFWLWLICVIVISEGQGTLPLNTVAGLDTFSENSFVLAIYSGDCDDLRLQLWRWFTYQFTHVGLWHVSSNIVMTIALGTPLEGLHGWLRMAIMYNFGVFGGACGYFVADPHSVVVGSSSGAYALLGIHLADLMKHWRRKRFRVPTLVLLLTLFALEGASILMVSSVGISHAAHIGGAIAGLYIGVLLGRNANTHVDACDQIIMSVIFAVGLGLVTLCVVWMGMQGGGPLSIFEAMRGESGWCWIKQVRDDRIATGSYECIRCGTRECIDEYSTFATVLPVDVDTCNERGYWFDGR